jgi:hypothetical protein
MAPRRNLFQHREQRGKWRFSPEGTAEGSRAVSAVPSGLDNLGTDQPNVETVGLLSYVPPGQGLCRLFKVPFFDLKS